MANGEWRMGKSLKREEYRSQLARRSQRRLQVCLLLALLGHVGAIGIVGKKFFPWFSRPEAVVPVEFVDLSPVEVEEVDLEKLAPAKTIAPVDILAGGVSRSDLSVGAGEQQKTQETQVGSLASTGQARSGQSHLSSVPLASTVNSEPVNSEPVNSQPMLSMAADQLEQWLTQALPASLSASVDRFLNSNRTQSRSAGVDARRDQIWGRYDAALQRKIRENWQSIRVGQSRQVKVRLVIDRQGELQDLKILRASGDGEADAVALNAVRSAAPFAPFPSEATQDALQVDFTFEYFAATN